ncbi:hypothetical protein LTR64_000260 [Lithohypha guttulata]|uniref:Amidase domain-containing protein n=1 Tax=Lithohypha guttulata TaxID=1690604 RepID=A0AAN7Q769_9EURO|nr:hypothetical protein LTR51_007621 [Lithohypha guttulata]KAK5080263.1 hypothetical protein LTR05_008711 [Lithohypha guttulata]
MQTTAGSYALLGCKVPKDAHIVHLLRKAGAIPIGKSNLDEWAGMRSHSYSCGYSARGGQCRNSYILTRSPNGSSSGSAVAVSANLVPLAFGTETDCSIISPAAVNGVVAIKPTIGLTSRGGVVPISETQDSVGSFGRSVKDCARAMDVIVGSDPDDRFSTMPDRREVLSYSECVTDHKSLRGAKFGLPMKRFWHVAPQPQRRVIERVLDLLQRYGASIVEVDMPCAEERLPEDGEWDWERYGESNPEISEITVSAVQTYYLMNQYLSKLTNTPIRTLEDVAKYNDENRGSEGGHPYDIPAFPDGQPLFRQCVETKGIKTSVYHAALRHITKQCRENGIDAALNYRSPATSAEVQLDALLFCDVKRGGIQIAAQAGYPVMTIPAGLDPDGMPVSLVLLHSKWQDDKLIKWASAIEDMLVHQQEQRARLYGKSSIPRNRRLGRIPPTYMQYLRKNIPVEKSYHYKGSKNETDEPWPDRRADPDPGRNHDEDELDNKEVPRYLV